MSADGSKASKTTSTGPSRVYDGSTSKYVSGSVPPNSDLAGFRVANPGTHETLKLEGHGDATQIAVSISGQADPDYYDWVTGQKVN